MTYNTTEELRAAIEQALADGPLGIRETAAKVGLRVRDIRGTVQALEDAGRIRVQRPGGGYRAGERTLSLP